MVGLDEIMPVRCPSQNPVHSKCSKNVRDDDDDMVAAS